MTEQVAAPRGGAWTERAIDARATLFDIYGRAWLSQAITAVTEIGVPDYIKDTPTSSEEVALKTRLHPQALYRVLRALASSGVFEETSKGYFRHNDVSALLRTNTDCTWQPMARLWWHPPVNQAWANLQKCLTNGKSGFENAFGMTLYEYLNTDKEAASVFNQAMVVNSHYACDAIARAFEFDRHHAVMDLGGGVGTLLVSILKAYPHLKGINLETAHLAQSSLRYIQSQQLTDRCSVVAGDFLKSVPDHADLFIVKNSLWNWSDEDCLRILTNVRSAIGSRKEARFIIVEYIISTSNARWSTTFDLQMLVMPGGRARTVEEYSQLLNDAGFRIEDTRAAEDETLLVAAPI